MKKDVLILAVEFKELMNNAGRKFKYPQSSGFDKTYAYRYFDLFYKKCQQDNYNLEECKLILKFVVQHAKEHKLLSVGTAILNRNDIIEICIEKLNSDSSIIEIVAKELVKMNNEIPHADRFEFLSKKISRNGLPKIIMLKNSGSINNTFISLSKSSRKFISSNKEHQSWFKSMREYMILNARMFNQIGAQRLTEIFGDDLFIGIKVGV